MFVAYVCGLCCFYSKTKMASMFSNPKQFSIDEAFEEETDDAIRIYGTTTEQSPLNSRMYNANSNNDKVSVWIQYSNQRQPIPAEDVSTLYLKNYS